MKPFRPRHCLATLFLLVSLGLAADGPPLTTAQYLDQLHNYETQVQEIASAPQKAVALRDAVPDAITVNSGHGDVTVDLKFLRQALDRFLKAEPKAKPNIISALGSRLKAMQAEAELYDQPSRADATTRKRLDEILSAREFGRVRGPNALELFWQRVQAWIYAQLRKISPRIPDIEDLGQWFVWGMIALASAIAGVWLYRISRENMVHGPREIIRFSPSSRDWREWLADARARAAKGEWRDAVHFGFWAAVSRLESEGVWPPDKTRTPREYLNAIPGASQSKEPFGKITRNFEASWYGNRPTTEADFAQFAANLERLGCQ